MYIAVEPLIAALFDLPENLRFLPSKNKDTIDNQSLSGTRQGALRPSLPRNKNSTSTSSFWRSHDLTTTRRSFGHDDEGGETDNTSLLHGENISLTDEEFSDAAAHFSSRDQRNRMAEFPTPMQYSTISSHFSRAVAKRLSPIHKSKIIQFQMRVMQRNLLQNIHQPRRRRNGSLRVERGKPRAIEAVAN